MPASSPEPAGPVAPRAADDDASLGDLGEAAVAVDSDAAGGAPRGVALPPRLVAATPWLLLGLALAVRLAWLALRPPHSDEGVNGWFVEKLLQSGFYRYDPENYHGPLHYYLLAAARLLFGRNLWSLRLPTVVFGAAAVWLAARCEDALGRRTAWAAALLLAVSPAMVLYSRWAIHESDFLFFSLLAFRGLCRWSVRPAPLAVWQVGIGAAGLLLTKEVWIVHVVCAGAAWVLWRQSRRWLPELPMARPPWREAAVVAGACLAVTALFYAGFGRDPAGLSRFFAPFTIWTDRAIEGAGHEKPWHYWLGLLARYEQPALLGLAASPLAALLAPPALRLLAIYAGGIFVAYSLVPYKTPWCVLQLVWPLAFTAAWAIERGAARLRRPALGTTAVLLLAVASAAFAWRVNALRYDDEAEPYVYVQTYRNGLAPVQWLLRAAERDPSLREAPIHVVMGLSWPIPWLLSDFTHTGHWTAQRLPEGDAIALFVDEPNRAAVEARLRHRYLVVPFDPSTVHPLTRAYFDAARFAGQLPAGTEVFDPAGARPDGPQPGLTRLPAAEWPAGGAAEAAAPASSSSPVGSPASPSPSTAATP